MQDALLDGAPRDEVGQDDVVLLTDPVDAAEALLDLHRIPRQVHVHHRMAELQIAPLARGLGAEQHRHLVTEGGDGLLLVLAGQTAVIDGGGNAHRAQRVGQRVERGAKRGEVEDLFLGVDARAEPVE